MQRAERVGVQTFGTLLPAVEARPIPQRGQVVDAQLDGLLLVVGQGSVGQAQVLGQSTQPGSQTIELEVGPLAVGLDNAI